VVQLNNEETGLVLQVAVSNARDPTALLFAVDPDPADPHPATNTARDTTSVCFFIRRTPFFVLVFRVEDSDYCY
jgi:hypothetical protein